MATNSVKIYTFAAPHPQRFIIPSNIIYYILKNPCSSKGYEKLQKTCKYFYSKNQIFAVKNVYIKRFKRDISRDDYYDFNVSNCAYKFWITNQFSSFGRNVNIQKIFQKIYRFDARSLNIDILNFTFNEFKLFTASPYISKIYLFHVKIQHSNGSIVAIDEIIQLFPNLTNFHYEVIALNETLPVNSNSMKNLLENSNFQKIKNLKLQYLPETFDLVTFLEFLKLKKDANIELAFGNNLSENYKIQLQNLLQSLVNYSKLDEFFYPPKISSPVQNNKNYHELHKLRSEYIRKKDDIHF